MARQGLQGERVSGVEARRLLLGGQGLLEGPVRATAESVYGVVAQLGFVQVDSINVVERAHHLILGARLSGYRPSLLELLLERQRRLFEHWTHDAAVIPTVWYPHWSHRFEEFKEARVRGWWRERMGPEADSVVARVRSRLKREGPLAVRDVAGEAEPGPGGSWWGWSPAKAALEYLWRTGEVAIAGRRGFHKLYDLAERVLPEVATVPGTSPAEHLEWACGTALERLGVATAREIAAFWRAVPAAAARGWCEEAAARGEIAAVAVEGEARPAFAVLDWRQRAGREAASPSRIRLLCPFDPVLRDRQRALRVFGFDFRFEGFVPKAERRHGYYVMPILEGERLIGRIDPKLNRGAQRLEVRSILWEPGIRPSRRRLSALDAAIGRLASRLGAGDWSLPAAAKK